MIDVFHPWILNRYQKRTTKLVTTHINTTTHPIYKISLRTHQLLHHAHPTPPGTQETQTLTNTPSFHTDRPRIRLIHSSQPDRQSRASRKENFPFKPRPIVILSENSPRDKRATPRKDGQEAAILEEEGLGRFFPSRTEQRSF